jgi:hypothetical protein
MRSDKKSGTWVVLALLLIGVLIAIAGLIWRDIPHPGAAPASTRVAGN